MAQAPRKRTNTPKTKDTGNRIRVRGKRLDRVDQTKLTLAYWLLAKQIVEDKTDKRKLTEPEVREVMRRLDRVPQTEAAKPAKIVPGETPAMPDGGEPAKAPKDAA
jgi:hypothetical protein